MQTPMGMQSAFQEAAELYKAATNQSGSASKEPAVQAIISTAESLVCPHIGNRKHHRAAAPQRAMDSDYESARIHLARAMCGCRLSALIMIELVEMLILGIRNPGGRLNEVVSGRLAAINSTPPTALTDVLMTGFRQQPRGDPTLLNSKSELEPGLYLAVIVRWVAGWGWTPYHTFVLGIHDGQAYVLSTWMNSDCGIVVPATYSIWNWDILRSALLGKDHNQVLKTAFGRNLEPGEYHVYLFPHQSLPGPRHGGRKRLRRSTRRKRRRKLAHRKRTRGRR